jgi:hypothetical protein
MYKLGEIKAMALVKMGIHDTQKISMGDIEGLEQDNTYAPYLNAMLRSIERCIDRFYVKRAIPVRPLRLSYNPGPATKMTEFFDADENGSKDYVTDDLLRLIPLYIVGDVFSLDEPDYAVSCRNEFESALEEYALRIEHEGAEQVQIIYGVD